MTLYLVPCDCGHEISVGTGRAGGSVVCDVCGRQVSVPKLRELTACRRAEASATSSQTPLRPSAAGVAGVVAAVLIVGSWLIMPKPETVRPADLRAAVEGMTDQSAYEYWKEMMSKARVQRAASPDEKALLRRHGIASVFSTMMLVWGTLAAVGAVAAAAAAGQGRSRHDRRTDADFK